MKKLLFFVLVLAAFSFGQNGKPASVIISGTDTLKSANTAYNLATIIKMNIGAYEIEIENHTSGSVINYGFSSSLSTGNAIGFLYYTFSKGIDIDQTNKLYLIADKTNTIFGYRIKVRQ